MGALSVYQGETQNLLQLPLGQPNNLYPPSNITLWINQARGQLAGEAECIRVYGTISTQTAQRAYNFTGINLSSSPGVVNVFHVRQMFYGIAGGLRFIPARPWEWFELYSFDNANPAVGPPKRWAQYAQGINGSFYLDPPPDRSYNLSVDCVCQPNNLNVDTDPEAIPYPWTDAVPFLAAYYALLSAQTSARQADAERMYQHYETYVERARKASNPSVNRWMYQQAVDPVQLAKLGMKPPQAAGGQ